MRWWVVVVVTGCGGSEVRTCEVAANCVEHGQPGDCTPSPESSKHFCTYTDGACASGERWGLQAGDGLADMCVVGAAVDGGTADGGTDGGTVDATADAALGQPDAGPPFQNGQAADLVLGQPDFTSNRRTTAASARRV